MYKPFKTLILLFIITSLCAIQAKAAAVKINDLIENQREFNGQVITIQGEVIGESMNRGDYSWININDGSNAIGIWLKKSDVEKIKYYGNYKNLGDEVEIVGTFSKSCIEHGGEADIHATSILIVKEGHLVKEHIDFVKIIISIIILFITLIIYLLFLKVQNTTIKRNI
jgi:hypothetical protein